MLKVFACQNSAISPFEGIRLCLEAFKCVQIVDEFGNFCVNLIDIDAALMTGKLNTSLFFKKA